MTLKEKIFALFLLVAIACYGLGYVNGVRSAGRQAVENMEVLCR